MVPYVEVVGIFWQEMNTASVSALACVSMVSAADMLYSLQSGSFRFFFHHIFSWGVLTGLLVCFGARRNKSCLFEEFEKARGLLMKQKNPEACWKVRWCWTCLSAQDTRCQFRKSATSGQGNVHELCLKKVSCLKLQKTRPRKRTHGFKKFQWKNMLFTLNIHTLPTNKKTRISIWIKK